MIDESARNQRRAKLDEAVREYMRDGVESGDFSPGIVSGWVLGVCHSVVNERGEFDNHLVESNPGINNYMARGLADATAKAFASQSSMPYDPDEE